MAKPSMKGALKRSMEQENQDFDRRFERAEQVLGSRATLSSTLEPAPVEAPEPLPPVEKVVRDSFTMPQGDHDRIQALRERCLKGGVSVSKSELVRAGLSLLQALGDRELLAAVQAVDKVRTGRPKR